jgi:hypothetical protein
MMIQALLCEVSAYFRTCKGFHQPAASAKLNPKLSSVLRLFWCTMRCIVHQKRPRPELNLSAFAQS